MCYRFGLLGTKHVLRVLRVAGFNIMYDIYWSSCRTRRQIQHIPGRGNSSNPPKGLHSFEAPKRGYLGSVPGNKPPNIEETPPVPCPSKRIATQSRYSHVRPKVTEYQYE